MPFAVSKKFTFLFVVAQIGTGSQFNGIRTECFFHTRQIVRFSLCMNPFIQKEIGYITQQKRTGIIGRLQSCQQVICRMMPILPETFCQRTDVEQIIRLQNYERRRKHTRFINRHIQQINLGMPPQQTASFCKFVIDLRHIIAHP